MKELAEFCDPAPFGRNHEDVYDETYRKAGKLDNQYFSTNFAPHSSGLVASLKDTLLEGHNANMSLYCELYKRNVYGQCLRPASWSLRAVGLF